MLFLWAGTIKNKQEFISLYELLFMHFKGPCSAKKKAKKLTATFKEFILF